MNLSAFVTIGVALCLSLTAWSFPDMGRLGYSSCNSCHISPSGGGLLNPYGRTMAAEVLGSYSWEGAGGLFYGLAPLPKFLDIGGDVRTARLEVKGPGFHLQKSFLMQADLEAAVHIKNLTFSAMIGSYGEEIPFEESTVIEPEARRYYAMLRPNRSMTIRAGKFFPAYGLMIADHSASIRKGLWWSQGAETYNLEIGVYQEYGEFIVTMAQDPEDGPIPNYQTGRLIGYVGRNSQVGVSYYTDENENESIGIHTVWAWSKKFWTLAEFDTKTVNFDTTGILWTSTKWEPWRGVVGKIHYSLLIDEELEHTAGLGLQWFPIPHYEFSVDSYVSKNSESYILISHYYF